MCFFLLLFFCLSLSLSSLCVICFTLNLPTCEIDKNIWKWNTQRRTEPFFKFIRLNSFGRHHHRSNSYVSRFGCHHLLPAFYSHGDVFFPSLSIKCWSYHACTQRHDNVYSLITSMSLNSVSRWPRSKILVRSSWLNAFQIPYIYAWCDVLVPDPSPIFAILNAILVFADWPIIEIVSIRWILTFALFPISLSFDLRP